MNQSNTGLQLRQRGLAVAGGGFLLQLLALALTAHGGLGFVTFLLLVGAVGATVLSFSAVKDHTGAATGFTAATAVGVIVLAIAYSSGLFGVIVQLIGAGVSHVGNKQLAAGIKS
jgi:hypothetical protein